MSALALRGVGVSFGRRAVLEGVTLDAAAGTWAAVIGPNGAGKTTLLRAAAGLVAHRGTVLVDGRDAAGLGRRERARRIAVVPQAPVMPADLRVREYVLLGRTPHAGPFGGESARDRAAAERAITRLDLGALAARPLGSLSGGERQRAVLARALAQEPGVVLLDEPTTALDLARQQQVLELVDDLRAREGLAVVAAMHDLSAAALYADAVHLVSAGRLVASGPPADVIREALLAEHFGVAVRVLDHGAGRVVVPVRGEAPACAR
jgi:iron complex transport system ATP-binding protein